MFFTDACRRLLKRIHIYMSLNYLAIYFSLILVQRYILLKKYCQIIKFFPTIKIYRNYNCWLRQMTKLSSLSHAQDIKDFFSLSLQVTSTFPMNHAIFLTWPGLIVAFIVFPKYVPDLYVFLISVRIKFFPHPPFRSTCQAIVFPRDEFAARGLPRRNSIFAISPDCRRNREAENLIPFVLYPPIDFTSLLDLFTSREISRLISRFKLNFCFFVSFVALDQLANEIKWPSNRLVIAKSFPKATLTRD